MDVAGDRFLARAGAAIRGANFTTQRFNFAWSTVTPLSAKNLFEITVGDSIPQVEEHRVQDH